MRLAASVCEAYRLDMEAVLIFPTIDVVGDIIYQAAHISYLAKGDPEKRVITVPGFAVFHRVPPGGEDEGKTSRFDVYIDTSPLAQRMKEVAALAKE